MRRREGEGGGATEHTCPWLTLASNYICVSPTHPSIIHIQGDRAGPGSQVRECVGSCQTYRHRIATTFRPFGCMVQPSGAGRAATHWAPKIPCPDAGARCEPGQYIPVSSPPGCPPGPAVHDQSVVHMLPDGTGVCRHKVTNSHCVLDMATKKKYKKTSWAVDCRSCATSRYQL